MNNEINRQKEFQRDSRNEPMSVKDWLITYLITVIPIVNIVMLITWAVSDKTNVNKRNWARAGFLMMGIMIAFAVVINIIALLIK